MHLLPPQKSHHPLGDSPSHQALYLRFRLKGLAFDTGIAVGAKQRIDGLGDRLQSQVLIIAWDFGHDQKSHDEFMNWWWSAGKKSWDYIWNIYIYLLPIDHLIWSPDLITWFEGAREGYKKRAQKVSKFPELVD